ncbi:hypothetical protein L7F22_063641 [Adiantum nelumboides]|nr:hypothetical protein [Adiantum nelumboides]
MYENRLFKLKSSAASVGEIVSLEDAFAAQQRLLSQRRMNTLKMAAGSCRLSRENTVQNLCKNQAMDIANIQVVRSPSETEVILKLIKSIMKRKMDKDVAVASSKHLELLEAMRKEYSQARLVTSSQRMRNAQLTGEKFVALDDLRRAKGQVRYLQGLAKTREKSWKV